jgi:lysozyme family protein
VNFDTAFERLIGHEGGYVDHPKDPGGETKFGISKRSYPQEDIKNLTLERAKAIYKRDYWDKVRGDDLPYPIAFEMFDAGVNHGVSRAIEFAQQAVGMSADGDLNDVTFATLLMTDADRFVRRFNGVRLKFFTDLRTWPAFGKGWERRVASNLLA